MIVRVTQNPADGQYRDECTESLLTPELKRHRAWLLLGWGTAWEDIWVLSAFVFFDSQVNCTNMHEIGQHTLARTQPDREPLPVWSPLPHAQKNKGKHTTLPLPPPAPHLRPSPSKTIGTACPPFTYIKQLQFADGRPRTSIDLE